MKNIWLPLVFITCSSLFIAAAQGQTVTINSVSGTSFCAGDSISVTFTVTGFWGHRNAFTLQLSDPSGSFSNGFKNIGSLVDTLPGTFTINTIIPWVSSTHYRFRILAAIPFITSADNGSDIAIWSRPDNFGFINMQAGSTGTPITITAQDGALDDNPEDFHDSAFWDFGSGATPAKAITGTIALPILNFSENVTYSTTGDKTITLTIVNRGGCSETITDELHIYDCSIPSIPHDAIVINSDTTIRESHKTYWVNPGFTLYSTEPDTIFAEPGSTISGSVFSTLYMKSGSVFTAGHGTNNIIYGDGASVSISSDDFTLNCPTLDFDYTNAPPNVAHPLSVKNDLNSVSITLFPNPTGGILSVQGLPSDNITVSVFNILGETVMVQKNPPAPDFTLDLSKLVPGTYYIRFSSANSVTTKMVVRE
ncbi:MAG TPA: T9SS type A sorting domain-containing protein [Candidatus Kapabacteria bacterium]|nr:T9SS type A sorting domain-containing protein [Candidatus Kapabacteria bacterium]